MTKDEHGALAVALWNLVDPGSQGGEETIDLVFRHVPANAQVTIQRVDDEHGNVLPRYAAMGRPRNPTPDQGMELNRETALPPPQPAQLSGGRLELHLTPNALVLVRMQP